jgi:LmbE family N-acetylglucosaminyl deacetylase
MTAEGPTLPEGRKPARLDAGAVVRPGLAVLVLAPHPDDFDEVGVTLRRFHRAGAKVRLAVLSSSANGVEDAFLASPSDAAKAAVRENEQRRSLAFFGLDPGSASFERLPTGEGGFLADDGQGRRRVAALLAADDYDLVVLPHGRDTNPDHHRVCEWWRSAGCVRKARPAAWLFRDPKTIAMRLDLVAPFGTEEAAWKSELLLFHTSQQARNLRLRGHGLDERILRVNRDTARAAGLMEPYAEGFEIEAGERGPIIPGGAGRAEKP